jgi:hypothetical protein
LENLDAHGPIVMKLILKERVMKIRSGLNWPKIQVDSYNGSQQDALFLNFILIKSSTCFGQTSIIRSLETVSTAIGICHASYVDCLLARSGPR